MGVAAALARLAVAAISTAAMVPTSLAAGMA